MAEKTGKFQHEKNVNFDEYFKAVGVPYIPRKIMGASRPQLDISCDDGVWTIRTTTLLRSTEVKFKLGEEYSEDMPGGTLKNTTTETEDGFLTISLAEDGTKVTRSYKFTGEGCVITLTHEKSGQVAERHFKRA